MYNLSYDRPFKLCNRFHLYVRYIVLFSIDDKHRYVETLVENYLALEIVRGRRYQQNVADLFNVSFRKTSTRIQLRDIQVSHGELI